MENESYQADVIIAGGGIAGITTAIELLNENKKVLLIDRDEPENFGGLAKESFGGMFFVNSPVQRKAGIKDSTDLALKDWFSFASFDEDASFPKQWAEKYVHLCTSEVFDWLKKFGLKFFPVVHWVERGLFQPGNSVPRFHMVWGTGHGLTMTLIEQLKQHSKSKLLTTLFRHKVEQIEFQNGCVTGVIGMNELNTQPFYAKSDAVVVASGGICGSIERVKKNWYAPWGDPPETILNGSHQYAVGDLHDAVSNISGQVTHLDKMWIYAAGVHHHQAHPLRPLHGLSIVPPKSALWVNYQGKRFGPVPLITGYDTRFLVEQICKEPVKYSWQILNRKIALKELAISGSESNEAIRDKKLLLFLKTILFGNKKLLNTLINECEDFVIANSMDELVDKMNELTGENHVDKHFVQESTQQYDAQIDRGKKYFNDEQLRRIAHVRQYRGDRVRTCKFQKINDPKAMPLIAIREFILSRKSLGGIKTDLECRVLSKPVNGNQEPIEGLYAVGEAAGFGGGGIHGLRSLEGTFLGTCILTGRVAAQSISGKLL